MGALGDDATSDPPDAGTPVATVIDVLIVTPLVVAYPRPVIVVLAAVAGACVASFCCVVAERVPAHRSLGGRSTCVCGRQLRAHENVPILGWLALRGRARCCGARLPAYYVLAEAGLAAVAALAALTPWPVATALDILGVLAVLAVGVARARRV